MAKMKVSWTETAIAEFSRMLTYYDIRNGNDKYSRSVVKMVRESLKLVAKFPRMYRAVDAKGGQDVRVFHCDYFLICYKIKESQIEVKAVFDTRREPKQLDEETK